MQEKKIKWLIYTVLVGLIPVIARMVAWGVTKSGMVDFVTASDFVAFGLVLHISNINEIEHLQSVDESWKTKQNGCSIIFIALYSVMFTFGLIGDKIIDKMPMLICSIILSVISFLLSYSVYHYLVRSGAT